MKYHFMPVGMAITKKTKKPKKQQKNAAKNIERRELSYMVGGSVN
jgi:hypothetical protein